MKDFSGILVLLVLIVTIFHPLPATAGPYTNDLSKCIVESTTTDDRTALLHWIFSAASLHPALSSIASVSEEQIDQANKRTAELFTKLLTESCRQQATKAIQYEGQLALQTSFQILGQVAAKELFSSPEVSAGMAQLDKYMDAKELEALLSKQ